LAKSHEYIQINIFIPNRAVCPSAFLQVDQEGTQRIPE